MTRLSSSSFHNTEVGYDSVRTVSSNQTISLNGRIRISKKGWVIRILTFAFLSFLIIAYNLFVGLRNPQELPIMMYTGFVILISLFILTFGWIFYRNPSSSTVPVAATIASIGKNTYTTNRIENANKSTIRHHYSDLVSVIIPVYNQEKMIETVINAVSDSTCKNIEIIAVNDAKH